MQLFATNPNIDFMRVRRPAGIFSILLLVASIVLLATRGLNPGIDFKGGVLVELGYEQPVELSSVRQALSDAQLGSASVQYFGTQTDVLVRMAPDETADAAAISDRILAALRTVGQSPEMRRVEFVGAAVGDELAIDGALAALFALIGILIYVAFRFEWKFAVGAIAATSHDAIIVLGWFSLLGLEFDLTVLAAVLATIGYSLNDTIVVYDRVRERFLDLRRSEPVEVINSARQPDTGPHHRHQWHDAVRIARAVLPGRDGGAQLQHRTDRGHPGGGPIPPSSSPAACCRCWA